MKTNTNPTEVSIRISKKFLCLYLLCIGTLSLFSQSYKPGFIINQSGDSLRGYVLFKDHKYNRQHCKFKKSLESPAQSYTATDIRAYGLDNLAMFRSIEFISNSDTKNGFAEYMLKSTPSLLYYGNTYFVEKGSDLEELTIRTDTVIQAERIMLREVETFKSQLLEYFKSCPDISALVLASNYSPKSLFKNFKAYYECRGISYQSFIPDGNWIKVRLGAGITGNHFNIFAQRFAGSTYYFERTDPLWSQFISPFLTVHLSYPRLNQRLAVRTGIAFHHYNYFISDINDRAGVDLLYEMDLKSSHLEVPLHLMYNLSKVPDKVLNPYVFVGGGINFLLNFNGRRKTKLSSNETLSSSPINGRSTSFIFRGGLGSTIKIGSLQAFTEVSYESSNGFAVSGDNNVLLLKKSVGMTIGVYFR